jgi:glycopeptide antibiotics resistance protein
MSWRRLPLWVWWIPVVLFVSAPWFGFTGDAQWHRLYLVPFSDPEDKPRDLVTNVALFVPFGYSFLKHRLGSRRMLYTVLAAIAVSVCAELPQLFSTLRNPSATDVLAAAAGGLAGAAWRAWDEKGTG